MSKHSYQLKNDGGYQLYCGDKVILEANEDFWYLLSYPTAFNCPVCGAAITKIREDLQSQEEFNSFMNRVYELNPDKTKEEIDAVIIKGIENKRRPNGHER